MSSTSTGGSGRSTLFTSVNTPSRLPSSSAAFMRGEELRSGFYPS